MLHLLLKGIATPLTSVKNFPTTISKSGIVPKIAPYKKVLFCSGKLYFDLAEYRQKNKIDEVALIRLEQLYPLPVKQLKDLVKKYGIASWHWVQEEPLNMGAASFLKMNLNAFDFGLIGRKASASTATGYAKVHAKEQADIITQAFQI